MSTPTTSDREFYADTVSPKPEPFSPGKVIATLFGMLLIGLMITQGWWGPWVWR